MSGQQYKYDVFLNFRGVDTRHAFSGHLYQALRDKGIHTFMDTEDHQKEEEILPLILNVVEQSRTAIIVLSKKFAFSTLCLQNLSYILDCFKDKGRPVWPVFYEIDPTDVRKQTGLYAEAFAGHEEKFNDNMEKVQQWRNALTQVSSLAGWVSGARHDYELVQEIVKQVSKTLDRTPLLNIDYVVGMESRLQDVLSLLELESNSDGALMMGIYGAAGIGKTTLARVTYNMIAEGFKALCFLPDVRENSSIHGLVHLQNMVLSEVIGEKDSNLTNVDMGALRIKNRLKQKKVLLILDDVDTLEQLEALAGKPDWFGSGSRVIVTTRDRHLLAFHEVERTYEVQPLSPIDALELLSHQVFKQGDVDSSYIGILNELVSYASGLPLALKVIGSRLFGKSVQEWTNALHRFKRTPPSEIQKTLKTSFDSLREEEKSLFLDIACCFQGYDFSEALDILHAHHADDVKLHIDVLIDKSLISSSDGKMTLHPLIEDMGKEIVRQENPQEPGKRSRLWVLEDIIQVLKNNTGASSIEIIHLDSPLVEDDESIEWDGEAFKKMKNLKTLIIRKCKFSQAAKYLPKSLRVLEWWRYPLEELPSDFNPNQLIICKLPHMHITSPEASQSDLHVLPVSLIAPDNVSNISQSEGEVPQISPTAIEDSQTSSKIPYSKNQVSMSGQRYECDVFFLNHEDTRLGFTGNLWRGVNDRGFHTFMVDETLGNEEISPSFVKEIEQSKIVIVVLSKNFAFSSFCLDQLSEILDCIEDRVLPVFYNVDPSDVRRQIGAFGDAFQRWEEKYKDNMEKVQNWRKALIRVCNLSGWDCRPDRNKYEFEYVHEIVEVVSGKLRKRDHFPLLNTDYLVGIDFQLKNVLSLMELESKSDGALMVGIHGIGGVGKTTLAQEIYNMIAHQFDASCFLPDVTKKSSENGLLHLQNMLLSEMIGKKNSSFETVDRGALVIKNTLDQMKVLLILDDVDTLEPLEALAGKPDWFGPGSRLIFTTQDKHLLAFHGVERIYTVRPLNHTDSLELLSHQVFKHGDVDSSLAEIFNEMVSYTSGLPLALKVIGSSLCGQTVEQWTDVLHQLKRIPSNEIQKILKTCFNAALGKEEKSIFLDIACCFQGYKLVEALDILCAHRGDDVKLHINVLKDKSFVSISLDGMVTLHPLIEHMGKDIVRQEYPNEPGKRSRLWFHGDIVEVLKNNTGSSKIEIIHLDSSLIEDEEAIEWSGDAFKKMKNLKTLIIRKGRFSKAPKYLPDSLKVLEWWKYPSENLPYDFNPNQLVIHKLPNKGIMSPMSVELTEASPSGSQVPHTSLNVHQTLSSQVTQNNSQSFPLASQNSQIDSGAFQVLEGGFEDPKPITPAQTSSMDFKSNIWRVIGLMSSVVGLSCFGLSPSCNRLIRGWNAWKFILYEVICLGVLIVFLFIKQSSPSVGHVWYKIQGFFVMMLIAVYTFYYDKAVDGKPEILSLVSNAAFVLMSLSYSKLRKLAYEMGVFSFFLSCLIVQLWTINWKLIWIPICFGFPLFFLHSSSDPV